VLCDCRVLLDDEDMFSRVGGGGYKAYGIDKLKGAIVIVRPDGYVGTVAPLESLGSVLDYFAGFMKVF
jgi:phenol 2-monooxygenase (NADPH)